MNNQRKGFAVTVVCYLFKKDEVLLLYRNKKKNDINKHKYIGVGGHVEIDETPSEAAIREVEEETGLKVKKLDRRAIVYFNYDGVVEEMHVFTSKKFTGKIIECDEGELSWQKVADLGRIPMWEGDKYFLEPILKGEKFFELVLRYQRGKLIEHRLVERKEEYVN